MPWFSALLEPSARLNPNSVSPRRYVVFELHRHSDGLVCPSLLTKCHSALKSPACPSPPPSPPRPPSLLLSPLATFLNAPWLFALTVLNARLTPRNALPLQLVDHLFQLSHFFCSSLISTSVVVPSSRMLPHFHPCHSHPYSDCDPCPYFRSWDLQGQTLQGGATLRWWA